MKIKALIEQFRSDTDDLKKPYGWDDPELIRLFNEAEEEAAIRARLIFDRTSTVTEIPLRAGDRTVAYDETIFDIEVGFLVDASGNRHKVTPTDRTEQDRVNPDWRTNVGTPTAFVVDDREIEFSAEIDATYTLFIECYRRPAKEMKSVEDAPEINGIHHRMLVEWVKHRAYSKPDTDFFDAGKAKEAIDKFEDHFGYRPNPNIRKREQSNRPHRNKAYW